MINLTIVTTARKDYFVKKNKQQAFLEINKRSVGKLTGCLSFVISRVNLLHP